MKIEWLISGSAPKWVEQNYENGGYVYDTYVRNLLRESHDVIITYISRGSSRHKTKRILQLSKYLQKMRNIRFQGEIICRDLFSTALAPFDKERKNIVTLHHIDTEGFNNKLFYSFLTKRFFKQVILADVVVVVSDYWKDVLENAGCRNIEVIRNSFDLTQFEFDQQELVEFQNKLGIPKNKPLIYLGNAQPKKGYIESYQALKDIDATFVTTGKNDINLPILNLYLSYNDYLKLLRISSLVITMSKFNEGWCRTAHEAMLCKTAVIGSGKGGMKELLEEGGQIVCRDFRELPSIVNDILKNRQKLESMAVTGREYTCRFTLENFKQSWNNLVTSLTK